MQSTFDGHPLMKPRAFDPWSPAAICAVILFLSAFYLPAFQWHVYGPSDEATIRSMSRLGGNTVCLCALAVAALSIIGRTARYAIIPAVVALAALAYVDFVVAPRFSEKVAEANRKISTMTVPGYDPFHKTVFYGLMYYLAAGSVLFAGWKLLPKRTSIQPTLTSS